MVAETDIVAIGDSLTWGYPFGPRASWLCLTAHDTGLAVQNKGVNGETTGEMLARFEADVIGVRPAVVTILGGTNDAWQGVTVAKVRNNVQAMLDKARQAGIQAVVCLPPPLCLREGFISQAFLREMSLFLDAYRDAYRELAQLHSLSVLDFYRPLLEPGSRWGRAEYFNDAAHPNRRGYQEMAAAALKLFKKLF
ncbi:MAG: GDSL family lipase [Clostridia bacterium]|nr:GDSL family lipase [Clostridia bacterium]